MELKFNKLKLSVKLLLVMITLPVLLVVSLIYYSALQVVKNQNDPKEQLAVSTAQSVIDKLDRNFYERFGDVQAFAYNKLALEALEQDSMTDEVADFINTMTAYYVLYDLMMIVDAKGRIVAVNTKDKKGAMLSTRGLIGDNVSNEVWFQKAVENPGPEGGAYYSDFNIDQVHNKFYNGTGSGMDFAAPVRDKSGNILGVWRNRAGWNEVTVDIRKEAEKILREKEPEAFILILNHENKLIDANNFTHAFFQLEKDKDHLLLLKYLDQTYDSDKFIFGWGSSRGAYTYKGKGWKAITVVPKARLEARIFLSRDWLMALSYSLILLVLSVVVTLIFVKKISRRINKVQQAILDLSKGKLTEVEVDETRDEIGQMNIAFSVLNTNYRNMASFATEIGEGHFEKEYQVLSENDILGKSLVKMREDLKRLKEESDKRNKINEGLAEFAEITKVYASSLEFYYQILTFLIKHLGANQGALFIVDEEKEGRFLELKACYAYDKKKHVAKRIALGQGLSGQCALEKSTIYQTRIPENYISITSGLGEALPRNLLIVPMIYNEEIFGVVEIAAFQLMSQEQIAFSEKIAEMSASTVFNLKSSIRTAKLLEESRLMTEELKMREEEMSQNMEELHATQEQMTRQNRETAREIEELKKRAASKSVIK